MTSLATCLQVEIRKFDRSLVLLLAVVAPLLVAVFLFLSMLRMEHPIDWNHAMTTATAIWAYFMLPMGVTAITALSAQTEHAAGTWPYLAALPLPRWRIHAAKNLAVLALLLAMTLLLFGACLLAVVAVGAIRPALAATGTLDLAAQATMLGRIYASSLLLVAVQSWLALRHASFVPALAAGIGGTFFAVVANAAAIGVFLPWLAPVNQLATDPQRAQVALAVGCGGGLLALGLMPLALSRRSC